MHFRLVGWQVACSSTDRASAMADRILRNQSFVDELLEEYIQLKDLCLEYLEKGYNRGQGGPDGPVVFSNKVGSLFCQATDSWMAFALE